MRILRVNDDYLNLYDLRCWLDDKEVYVGDKFAISWKIGKRRKLKAYRLLHRNSWDCDCCGWITEITLGRGNSDIKLDNHFGPSYFGPPA